MSANTLAVIGNSNRLLHTAERLRRVATALRPVLIVGVVAGVVGWLAVAVNALLQAVTLDGLVITIVSLVTLAALALPWLLDQARREADAYARGFAAEERAAATLAAALNAEWTLLRSLQIPGVSGDVDAVLVGPVGVYCLEIKGYGGVVEYAEHEWYRHADGGGKRAIRPNPAEQLTRNVTALGRYLRRHDCGVTAQPRLFYAGDGGLLLENPTLPVWDANRPDAIAQDLLQQDSHINPDAVQALIALLRQRVASPTPSKTV